MDLEELTFAIPMGDADSAVVFGAILADMRVLWYAEDKQTLERNEADYNSDNCDVESKSHNCLQCESLHLRKERSCASCFGRFLASGQALHLASLTRDPNISCLRPHAKSRQIRAYV